MITLHHAILASNPSIVTIRGDVAYDQNNNVVEYDVSQAQAKLIEMQAEIEFAQQTAQLTKASALAKLSALGLTADEIKAITGE
jgi:RNase P/RNase MRP subunit p29